MKAGIAGAGIMGQLLAYTLMKKGWEVSLFDQGDESVKENCSMTAAGMLAPIAELEKSDFIIFQLGMEAIKQHWPDILEQLEQKIEFHRKGSLALAHPSDQADLLRWIDIINTKLVDKYQCKKLNRDEIHSLEPELTKFNEGYFFQDEGQINNQELLQVLRKQLSSINWQRNTTVEKLESGKIFLSTGIKKFDLVFDCRGIGAKSVFDHLRGVRGELVWLHAPEVNLTRPIRLLHPRYSLYIVPRKNNYYLLGASEIESENLNEITVRTTLELLTAAYYIHPGFAEAHVVKTAVHCRPTLLDHLPKIKYKEGYIAVNGLYRHGFLIAPTLMHEILKWVEHGISSISYSSLWEKCA